MKILVVEDEAITAEDIVSSLSQYGFTEVKDIQSGEEAIEFVKNNLVDLIFMDIQLSRELNGIETAKAIKELSPGIFIVFLTSFIDETMNLAITTEPLGYVVKPFNPPQLIAMIKIAQNKKYPCKSKECIEFLKGQFIFNTLSKELFYNNVLIHLRPKEIKLLELILQNKQKRFISNDQILYTVWDIPPKDDKTKRSLISSLNSKFPIKILKGNYNDGYKISID